MIPLLRGTLTSHTHRVRKPVRGWGGGSQCFVATVSVWKDGKVLEIVVVVVHLVNIINANELYA